MGGSLFKSLLIFVIVSLVAFVRTTFLSAADDSADLSVNFVAEFGVSQGILYDFDWETGIATFQVAGYCDESEDVLCRKFYEEKFRFLYEKANFYQMDIRSLRSDQIENLGTEDKHIEIIEFIRNEGLNDYVAFETFVLSPRFSLAVDYRIERANFKGRARVLNNDSQTLSVIDLQSSLVHRVFTKEYADGSIAFAIDERSCGNNCSGGISIYSINN